MICVVYGAMLWRGRALSRGAGAYSKSRTSCWWERGKNVWGLVGCSVCLSGSSSASILKRHMIIQCCKLVFTYGYSCGSRGIAVGTRMWGDLIFIRERISQARFLCDFLLPEASQFNPIPKSPPNILHYPTKESKSASNQVRNRYPLTSPLKTP